MKKPKIQFPVKALVITSIIFLALFLVIVYSLNVLYHAPYFTVRDIIVDTGDPAQFAYLKGANIFALDLAAESRRILRLFPDCRAVNLVRVLPNRIAVDFVRRKAIARVKLYKVFSVDSDGILFPTTGSEEENNLPLIVGLETKIFGPKPGVRYTTIELALALAIIREIKRNQLLRNYQIEKIDVASPINTVFSFPFSQKVKEAGGPERLEVKIGQGDIREKIRMLSQIMGAVKGDLTKVRYIDLRFKEVVIKYSDDKQK